VVTHSFYWFLMSVVCAGNVCSLILTSQERSIYYKFVYSQLIIKFPTLSVNPDFKAKLAWGLIIIFRLYFSLYFIYCVSYQFSLKSYCDKWSFLSIIPFVSWVYKDGEGRGCTVLNWSRCIKVTYMPQDYHTDSSLCSEGVDHNPKAGSVPLETAEKLSTFLKSDN
jgi:hypothetical protein